MIHLKTKEQIETMRRASAIVAEVLIRLKEEVRPGVSTADLDALAETMTLERGGKPAFKGYRVGTRIFPASLCTSINDEVVHGVPSAERVLHAGDVIGIDFGVCYEGFFGDSAVTVAVGAVDEESLRLLRVTEESLWAGIHEVRIGNRIGDVSAAIQERVERDGFTVVREFVGHGIGRNLHEDPAVPNYGRKDRGERLREGMVLAIEPMVNAGSPEIRIKEDGWTAVTRDGQRSAHFEHSVAVTLAGPVVLTQL